MIRELYSLSPTHAMNLSHDAGSARRPRLARCARNGFTLIEIMVVVVILGILAALVAPNVIRRVDDARVTKAQQDIRAYETALNLYRMDNFRYPATEQGLQALVTRPTDPSKPVMKLIQNRKIASRVRKKYDAPQTPYQRVLTSAFVPKSKKEILRQQYAQLNAAELRRKIAKLQDKLFKSADRINIT